MSSSSHLRQVFDFWGEQCHYCERKCWYPSKSNLLGGLPAKARASKDHVVPAVYGGANHPDNYVLACAGCNSKRGHELNWCSCDFCGPLLAEFKESKRFFRIQIYGIAKFNKPLIKKRSRGWKVYLHNKQYQFKSWADAIEFALDNETEATKTSLVALQEKFKKEF